jgi:hypothetical protein
MYKVLRISKDVRFVLNSTEAGLCQRGVVDLVTPKLRGMQEQRQQPHMSYTSSWRCGKKKAVQWQIGRLQSWMAIED